MDKPLQLIRFARRCIAWMLLSTAVLGASSCTKLAQEFKDSGKSGGKKENKNSPTISAIANVTVDQDESFTVNYTVKDADDDVNCQSSIFLTISDTDLFSPAQVLRSGTAPQCSLTFTPAPGYWGSSVITVKVYDGEHAASTSFTATVDEGTATPTVTSATVNEGSNAVFAIKLARPLNGAKTFNYATSNGTATGGTHYAVTAGSVVFAAGETVKTVSVGTTDDTEFAPDRTFSFTVTGGAAPVTGTGTIVNTDSAPTVSAANVGVNEGTNLVFTVNLNRPSATNTTVTYSTADVTAVAGTNYTAASGTLTFTPGQTSQTITISSQSDGVYTANLTFTLSLTANSSTVTATGTIVDIQGAPTASATGVSANEGSNLVFTVNLSQAAASTVTVNYATSNGTAVAGTNYSSSSGTLTFAAGQTSKTVTIASQVDGVYTAGLTFTLSLTTNAVTNTATGTITNTDAAPTASAANVTANEGSNLTFTVLLNRASSSATSVTYATNNGTAVAGTNYSAASGTITFNAGETSKTLTIVTLADNKYTGNLSFTVDLTANATTNSATGTVANIEGAPTATVANASANEGSNVVFTITLNRPSSTATNVAYATANGTATAGTHYTNTNGTLTFNAGETSKTVSVPTATDSQYAPDRTFTLSATVNSVTNSGTGTIVNTEAAPIATVDNVAVNEGGNLVFTVTISQVSSQATVVTYATADGTAKAGINYVAAAGTVSIPAGQTTNTVTITSIDDATYSTNLAFTLSATLNSITNSGTGTVQNTDTVPSVSVAAGASSVTEGNSVNFTFTLTNASAYGVVISYNAANGTATSGSDFVATSSSVTIPAGSLSANVDVLAYDDNADEQDETFSMQIASATNANLGTTVASVTIQDTALYFDFTSGSLPVGLTFARTGTATYYDSSGTIQTAATGVARFEYNPSACSGTCPIQGLLIEEARTNLLLRSSTFGTTWTSSGVTITPNSTTSPSGAADAEAIQSTSGVHNNTNNVTQAVNLNANTTYTLSFFVKNSSALRSIYEVNATSSGTTGKTITIDWTGTVPSASGGTVKALPNNWYRVSTTFTTDASDTGAADVNFYPSSTLDNGFVYLWGAQLEAGPTVSSYIATTAAMVTRNADSLVVNNFGTWFNATAWTAILDFSRRQYESATSSYVPTAFSSCDDTNAGTCASDFIEAVHLPSDNTFRGRSYVGSVGVATSNYTNAAALGDVKVQMAVSQTSAGALQTAVNGSAATASGVAAKPTTHNFVLGSGGLSGAYDHQINGHLKKFTYRSRALSAAQLQALTSD